MLVFGANNVLYKRYYLSICRKEYWKEGPFSWNDLIRKGWMLLMQKAAGRRLQIKVSWGPQIVKRIKV